MIGPRGLFLVLLVPGAVAWNANARLESAASALGVGLGRALPVVMPPPALPPLVDEPTAAMDDAPGTAEDVPDAAAHGVVLAKKGHRAKPTASAGPSVFVPASVVLRLARARAVPGSRPVPATSDRPGGVRLSGVGALGVGMQDGDVITEVAGRAVQSEGDVASIVIAALGRRTSQLSAVFYRGKSRGSLVVEIPYS